MFVDFFIHEHYCFSCIDTFILQNCHVTSPSIGTIRALCDSSHQIYITVTCTNNCTNPMVTASGNSPLTIGGLDPGIMYSIIINVFVNGHWPSSFERSSSNTNHYNYELHFR